MTTKDENLTCAGLVERLLMMTKLKTTEIPSRAKHLYIQLYCEKKGGKTDENLHNAAQSWLSLSLTKKQHFYDTITTKSAVEKAQRIIKTEPYLRPKFPANVRKRKRTESQGCDINEESDFEHATINHLMTPDDLMECNNSSTSFAEENYVSEAFTALEPESNIHQEECKLEAQSVTHISEAQTLPNSYMSIIDEDTKSSIEDNTNKKDAESVPLSEPVLPITKTGRDLFELLKARNGVNKSYDALTTREKNFYGHAVRAIKRDYVNNYKEYLESLSSRQLFDYYIKTFR